MHYLIVSNLRQNQGKTANSSITVRIPSDLKEQMNELDDVNWPDYIRAAIESRIKEARRKKAALAIDAIRNKTKEGDFDSLKSIQEDRKS